MAPSMKTPELTEAHPMNGGDDVNSYSQNSSYQRGVIDASKEVIVDVVTEKLDIVISDPFRIADFGCSTGPNTFLAMQNIADAVKLKYGGIKTPEIQVFFNDHVDNDFNILFRSLPPTRDYMAAAVPGSFYARLFPKASLHFVHCSYALHWLSKVPKEVQDPNSVAYNKGNIHYTGAEKNICKAYFGQFTKDFDAFLKARAREIVAGGLMVIQIPALPKGEVLFTRTGAGMLHFLLGESLFELAKLGVIGEEEVDSFNLPQYHPSAEEVEMLVEMDDKFTLEKIGPLNHPMRDLPFDVKMTSTQTRAIMEGLLKEQFDFGNETMDHLFQIFTEKLQENYVVFDQEVRRDADLCIVLKRKSN